MRDETPGPSKANDLDTVRAALERLPIFPLPSAVLLPYELLPLHIFEPRYRAMIRDAIQNGRPIAIAQLAPGWEGSYEQRPAVLPICGVGVLVRHEKLPDGRYNVLLRGIARVRIDSEHDSVLPYREVHATLLEDDPVDPEEAEKAADSLRRTVFSVCAMRPGPAANTLAQLAAQARAPSELADVVVGAVLSEPEPRRQALVMTDVRARLALAERTLHELLVNAVETPEPRYRN